MPEEIKTDSLSDDSDLNPLDRLAIGSVFGDVDGDEPENVEAKPETPAVGKTDVDLSALNDRLAKAEERAFQAEQRAQFTAGQLNLLRESAKPKDEPKPFQFNKDEFAAALEKDPAQAIRDLVENIASERAQGAAREVKGDVDNRFGQLGQAGARAQRHEQDRQKTITKFGKDLVEDKEFVKAADLAIMEIASIRTGKDISQVTRDDLQAGDLYAAASAVYADWARDGKLPKADAQPERQMKSLREIVAAVPKSDNLGTNGAVRGERNGAVSLKDMYTDKEILALRPIMKQFGITSEAEWIKHVTAAGREDEAFGR